MSEGEGGHIRLSEALGGGARLSGSGEAAVGLGLMFAAVVAGIVVAVACAVGVLILLVRILLWPFGWSARWVGAQSLSRTARMYRAAGANRMAYELHSMARDLLRDKEGEVSWRFARSERAKARKLLAAQRG